MGFVLARSRNKMTGGGGLSEWPTLTPPRFGPSVKAYLPAIVVGGSKAFSFPGCSMIRIVS